MLVCCHFKFLHSFAENRMPLFIHLQMHTMTNNFFTYPRSLGATRAYSVKGLASGPCSGPWGGGCLHSTRQSSGWCFKALHARLDCLWEWNVLYMYSYIFSISRSLYSYIIQSEQPSSCDLWTGVILLVTVS